MDCIGPRRPTSHRVHSVPLWPGEREGYKHTGSKPSPYHGYYYKMLTGQGPSAPDGAYDYVVRGKMIGGFAMVAYPAQYGSSGIMTFIVNHDGVVYQKDLGPRTTALGEIHDEVQSRRDVEETLTIETHQARTYIRWSTGLLAP